VARRHVEEQDHGLARALDVRLIEKCRPAIERGEKVQLLEEARNVNRTVGAMLSGELIRARPEGLPDNTIFIQMEGTGGQSFGAFLAKGITIYLIGDANDYTGKGLSGGRLAIRPSIDFRGEATSNIIVGNTVPLRRHQRRGVLPRRRRRALRGPPLGRDRGRRGHGRPRLRVHDRRHRSSCSARPGATSPPA
jgi:hypothetical protein